MRRDALATLEYPALLLLPFLERRRPLACPRGFAQDEGAPAAGSQAGADTQTATATGSEEAELSEDNYRRYMELKDQQIDASRLPIAAHFIPETLEKMQNLPEDSQKHLRNQLRDIILRGERWSPEEKQAQYLQGDLAPDRCSAPARSLTTQLGRGAPEGSAQRLVERANAPETRAQRHLRHRQLRFIEHTPREVNATRTRDRER